MNSEAKPFASLSSGLLARKGAARPAMRPQGFGQMGAGLDDLGWNDMGFEPPKPVLAPVRDGDEHEFVETVAEAPVHKLAGLTPSPTPSSSPVHGQQAEIIGRMIAPSAVNDPEEVGDEEAQQAVVPIAVAPRRQPRPRSAPGLKGKAAFTLRLDPSRHLKLRLACAVTGKSAQQLVTSAVDELLQSMPELESMVERAPASSKRASSKG